MNDKQLAGSINSYLNNPRSAHLRDSLIQKYEADPKINLSRELLIKLLTDSNNLKAGPNPVLRINDPKSGIDY